MRLVPVRTLLLPVLALTACSSEPIDPIDVINCKQASSCSLEIVSGDEQTAEVGFELTDAFVIRVVHSTGVAPPPVTIDWTVVSGDGSVSEASVQTDAMGEASTSARLGTVSGEQVFEASVSGTAGLSVQLRAIALAGEARTLELVAGDGQSAPAGAALPERLRVRVVDLYGNPVEEYRVSWFSDVGGGSVEDIQNITDASGEVTAQAVLGNEAGVDNNLFTARAAGDLEGSPANFVASADPGPAAALLEISGNGQGGTRGAPLPNPFIVRVTDGFGNAVRGATVAFSAGTGGGSIAPLEMATDENGRAEALATLGTVAGEHEFFAAAEGLMGSPRRFTATAFPPLCSRDDWCWHNPIPQGNDLRAVTAISATEVWVVGDHGTILNWNGAAWQGYDSGTTANLTSVFGAAGDDVWAVADDGTILHFNGTRWSSVASPAPFGLSSVWGASATEVWAVGSQGTLLRYDGNVWTVANSNTMTNLNRVRGVSATEVWALGDRGTLLRYDGVTWTSMPTSTQEDLFDIYKAPNGDLWLVGNRATISRWDGAMWQDYSPPTNNALHGVLGLADDRIWAVGDAGSVIAWDGRRWSNDGSGTSNSLYSIADLADGDFMAVGEAGVVLRRPGGVTWQSQAENVPVELQGAWGPIADDIWAVGFRSTVMRWDGLSWAKVEGTPRGAHFAIWGTAPDEVWVVGASGALIQWDGTTWNDMVRPVTEDLYTVWGPSSNDVWAGGVAGSLLHYDGASWTTTATVTSNAIYGIWGAASDDVWAVGDFGTLLHYDGTTWTPEPSPDGNWLLAIRGTAADDIWAVGAGGGVVHYDGVAWTTVPVPTTSTLYSLFAPAANDVWAVGTDGTILHYDGVTWFAEESGTSNLLFGVFGATDQEVWAVGDARTILRWTP